MQDYQVEQRLRNIQIMHKLLNHPKNSTLIESILSTGTSQHVLKHPNERINYVSSIWLTDLIHFTVRNNIKIITKTYMNIGIQRRNDKIIMDELLQSNLNKSKIIQVNACRLYLQIIYLSDVIEPDEKTDNPSYHSGKRSSYLSSTFT